ncbi:MAG: DUF4097 family beta strand repeat protein [Lachnospiraceae bacterium]|nr:DUF4097 family beta strand repeat protein [Lachnospiraceae bacterium]
MKKTKFFLLAAVVLMCVGIAFAAFGTVQGGTWNFKIKNFKVYKGSEDYINETVRLDAFDKVVVNTSTVDINIIKGNEYAISYNVPEDQKPQISNNGGVLTVDIDNEDFSFLNFSFFGSFEDSYVNITVPDTDSTKIVKIESSTGDIRISDLAIDGSISTSTGDINLKNNKMSDMIFKVSTGDITIDNCTMNSLETKASTGEVNIINSACAGKYTAKTSTGDITTKNTDFKAFSVEGSTSDISLDNAMIDNIDIKTSTGEVMLGLKGDEESYNVNIHTSTGDIRIGNEEFEKNYKKTTSTINSININTSTGDVDIDFGK